MEPLHHNQELFEETIKRISLETGISEAIVEKDYYVTLLLNKLAAVDDKIVFKGGTSVSKCFGLINRFSEDIDLNYDNERQHPAQSMKRKFIHELLDAADSLGFKPIGFDPSTVRSKGEYNKFTFDYSPLFTHNGLKNYVLVETSVRSPSFPIEKRPVSSIIGDFMRANNLEKYVEGLDGFVITTQSIERTFIDKVFAVADYYLAGKIEEHSRHLYDLYKIYPHVINKDIESLFSDVLLIRQDQRGNLSADPKCDLLQILKEVIEKDVYKIDFENITSNLLYEDITYDSVKSNLKNIIDDIEKSGIYTKAKSIQKLATESTFTD